MKGPNITKGYWQQPEVTAASFTDGWLHTGDAALVDDEGYYFIVDRWKDMYISGGENVYPAEVENVLYENEAIAEAAVIGVADARWGQVGRAIVVVKAGMPADRGRGGGALRAEPGALQAAALGGVHRRAAAECDREGA